jgi:hypothetical protein
MFKEIARKLNIFDELRLLTGQKVKGKGVCFV